MKLTEGEERYGFTVEEIRAVQETEGELRRLRHRRSGAVLYDLDCKDPNMVYSVSFATPSENSTGVFHILEHSVLCGSEKYPSSDPFVDLMKGSLYTFLNAMTFPDRTMYPVASQNEKDLMNLMRVYTDAVFRPLILRSDRAFRQEGWHIAADENGAPCYQGVVYNEMKGALADPEEILINNIQQAAYRSGCGRCIYGGDPNEIVHLTYEEYLAAYRKHYCPANAVFFLYGDLDLDEKLRFLDTEYLSVLAPGAPVRMPATSLPDPGRQVRTCTYPARPEMVRAGRDYIAYAFPMAPLPTFRDRLGALILAQLLAGSNFSPLKKELLERGLSVETVCTLTEENMRPLFLIELQECDAAKQDEIRSAVFGCLEGLVRTGFDPKLVESAVCDTEFTLRESNFGGYPKGLYYNIELLSSVLYGGEPWRYLAYEEPLREIRSAMGSGYFEKLLASLVTENPYRTEVVLTASDTEGPHYSSPAPDTPLTPAPEETPPAGISVPRLGRSDIRPDVTTVHTAAFQNRGAPYFVHDLPTRGILYVRLHFDLSGADRGELFLLSVLSRLIGDLPTENRTSEQIQIDLGLLTGGIVAAVQALPDGDRTHAVLSVRMKALASQYAGAAELLDDLLRRTVLEDATEVRKVLLQLRMQMRNLLTNGAQTVVRDRASAAFSGTAAVRDAIGGIGFYEELRAAERDFGDGTAFLEKLRAVRDRYLLHGRCRVTFGCDAGAAEKIGDVPLPMAGCATESEFGDTVLPLLTGSTAVIVPADIQFNGYARDIRAASVCRGTALACRQILNLEYLWHVIREQNGAYGCGSEFSRSGVLSFWTYRDPQLQRTLDCCRGAGDFLRTVQLGDADMDSYLIGCVRGLDFPLTPEQRSAFADTQFFMHLTDSLRRQEREELLATGASDVRAAGERIAASGGAESFCTAGSREAIEERRSLFETVLTLD